MSPVPQLRIDLANQAPLRADGQYVLYWMIASRRIHWNFALDRALAWAQQLGQPLVILEALRIDYPWASDRLHTFILEGMAEHAAELQDQAVTYYPYVEPKPGAGRGLLEAWAQGASVVVTDEFPCFFLPEMVQRVAQRIDVKLEQVDSNGLLPLRASPQVFHRAYDFRRFLQKTLPTHLGDSPNARPLARLKLQRLAAIPASIARRWPSAEGLLEQVGQAVARLPIDHAVGPAVFRGGSSAARQALDEFLAHRLPRYAEQRSVPDQEVTSGLSPYLHFGQLSVHEVFHKLAQREQWTPERLGAKTVGKREGWWGTSSEVESFLDELVTWRELGYNFAHLRRDYHQYESLPDWAQATLAKHAPDRRAWVYDVDRLAQARTHDPLWNAAQTQLLREGRMQNYLRMLWGKKILEWSDSPRQALESMIELNNRFAVDGRNPNSYCGIFWVLGRYDRPWAPERPIFGTIRYMSSENTARKFSVRGYLARYGSEASDDSGETSGRLF